MVEVIGIKREDGDASLGDERRFIIKKVVEEVVIPRGLKEDRARLVEQIAEIDEKLRQIEA